MEVDMGELIVGQPSIKEIQIVNDKDSIYAIRKITPYCSCTKILDYDKEYVSPLESLNIKLSVTKNKPAEGITKVELILESPTDDERFVIIDLKFKVLNNNDKSTVSGRGSRGTRR